MSTAVLEIPSPVATPVENVEVRIADLGRPPWTHLKRVKVAGTSNWVDVEAGLFFYDSMEFGTYYSADGRSYLCNIHKAANMAERDETPLKPIQAGKHTGAVLSVNLLYR